MINPNPMNDRDYLEGAALEAVCPINHFDLAADLDTATDDDLHRVIKDPCHIHKAQGYDCNGEELGEVVNAPALSDEDKAAQREELIEESK